VENPVQRFLSRGSAGSGAHHQARHRRPDRITLIRIEMIGLEIAMGAFIYLSSFFYREKRFTQGQKQLPFFKSFKECFANRSFVIFETISFTGIFDQTA
jgi:hypothetical protein